jgi:hypothetical protein
MLSASATLIAAINSLVRIPLARAVVSWGSSYDDVSELIESVEIDSNITTDLPDEANFVQGPSATQVRMKLAGRTFNGVKPAQLVGEYNEYLMGAERISVPVDVDLGFRTSAGDEYLNQFVGRVRSVDAESDGTATIAALDGTELLHDPVTLPTFAAFDPNTPTIAPGLDSSWVIDWIARENGYYSVPPTRPATILDVPLQGSTWPWVGTLLASAKFYTSGNYAGSPPFATASTLPYPVRVARLSSEANYASSAEWLMNGTVAVGTGNSILVEAFLGTNTGSDVILIILYADNNSSFIEIFSQGGSNIGVRLSRGGFTASYITPGGSWDGTVKYIGVSITTTGTGANVSVRIGGVTHSGTITVAGSASADTLELCLIGDSSVNVGGLQVSTTAIGGLDWQDDYVPTAIIDAGLELVVTPNVEERQPWSLLQEIAYGTQGVVLFDETGTLRYYSATRLAAIATFATSVATVTTTSNLKAISTSEAIDTVRNIVRVPANPYVIDRVQSYLWELSESLSVPANSAINIAADVAGVVLTVDESFSYYAGAYSAATGSGYRAARNADGTGGDISNLSISVQIKPSRLIIRVSNPNAFDAWLVGNSLGDTGTPLLKVAGRLARLSEDQYRYSARDEPSILKYGEQSTELGENPWRQTAAGAEALANTIIARTREPHQLLQNVEIVGNPRLQLTDRITVIEQDNIGVVRDYMVVGKSTHWDVPTGLAQRLLLREVGPATNLDLIYTIEGDNGSGALDSIYGLA